MNNKSINNKATKTLKTLISNKVKNFKKLKPRQLPQERFNGAGIYALYYNGDNELYKGKNSPVYIGRVQTKGQKTDNGASSELYSKIKEQCKAIEEAKNLDIKDFNCKYMVLDEMEMSLSESIEKQLVNHFKPTWNLCIEGFANHNPGKSRIKQAPSDWDVLHPGRSWAKKLQGKPRSKSTIKTKLKRFVNECMN